MPDSPASTIAWRERAYLPLREAAQIVGLSRASLYKFESDGRLEFRRLAGRTLVATESLILLIDGAEPWTPSPRGDAARAKRKERAQAAWAD